MTNQKIKLLLFPLEKKRDVNKDSISVVNVVSESGVEEQIQVIKKRL